MMEDMELWVLPTPAALMAEIASGSLHTTSNWPTPTCADAYTDRLKSSQQQEGSMHSVNLSQAVNMRWPTPDTMNGRDGSNVRKDSNVESGGAHGVSLHHAVHYESRELARPTPSAHNFEQDDVQAMLDRRERVKQASGNGNGFGLTLGNAVKVEVQNERRCGPWPTPLANSGTGSGVRGEGGLNLQTAVSEEKVWPWATPAAQDGKNSSLPPSQFDRDTLPGNVIASGSVGVLNPSWEECLMCWPVGWTQAEPLPVLNWPWRDFRGVVAFRGQPQHAWEPPRTVPKLKDRNKRVKAVGNGQDPSALVLAVKTLLSMNVPQSKRAA